MKEGSEFYLHLESDRFGKGDILVADFMPTQQLKVLHKPRKKWYHKLFQYITFGLYKASWYYRVEVIEDKTDIQI